MRCGAVRCGAVRCGAVRCGAVRCGAVRCDAMRCDNDMIWGNCAGFRTVSAVVGQIGVNVHYTYLNSFGCVYYSDVLGQLAINSATSRIKRPKALIFSSYQTPNSIIERCVSEK